MQSTGSFGAAIGGMSPELQAAMQRRAGSPSAPTSAQVSNSAPTANPMPQIPQGAPPAPQGIGQTSSTQPPSESVIIVKALGDRLKRLADLGV